MTLRYLHVLHISVWITGFQNSSHKLAVHTFERRIRCFHYKVGESLSASYSQINENWKDILEARFTSMEREGLLWHALQKANPFQSSEER